MNKELQDLAWSVLPKEFKEEVKKIWEHENKELVPIDAVTALNGLFGKHNLTSDAEGEEMLMVTRNKVQEVYKTSKEIVNNEQYGTCQYSMHTQIMCVLENLFGSKCLPDKVAVAENATTTEPKPVEPKKSRCEKCGAPNSNICAHMNCQEYISQPEPKLAELKYHKGEKVYYNGYVYEVEGLVGKNRYALKGLNFDLDEDMIEPYKPYTEPKEENHIVENHEMVDNILKDGFSKERRLNIATQMVKAIMQCPESVERIASAEADSLLDDILHDALYLTDRLMSECEKGGMK